LGSEEPFLAFAAADALIAIGLKSIPALTNAVLSTNVQIKAWALSLLGDITNSGPKVILLLQERLSDTNDLVVAAAVNALGKIGPPAASAANSFSVLLAGTNAIVRYEVIEALWRIKRENHLAALKLSDLPTGYQRRAERLREELVRHERLPP
jgi:HEAT repeat protein